MTGGPLPEFAAACRRLYEVHPVPALLGCAQEADRLALHGWDEARLQQLVAGVPPLRVPGQAALVREVLDLAMRVRLLGGPAS